MKKLLFVAALLLVFSACEKANSDLERYRAQIGADSVRIRNYLIANNIPIKKVSDTIGVYYQILDSGRVASAYTSSTLITVGYTAKVIPDTASVSKTNAFNPSYTLGNVIRGWQVGIPLIKKYGRIRLFVPSRYAYGKYEQTGNLKIIPANSCLDFDINLYNVSN
ncbi:MAG: peptidylprolyl isomerase [Sphingobacteriaceae bacterium]|nr:MAG: peptidylprolyl isomerase [Sphingobacteriaceae bacterium]